MLNELFMDGYVALVKEMQFSSNAVEKLLKHSWSVSLQFSLVYFQ